jgi:hypothetical protein
MNKETKAFLKRLTTTQDYVQGSYTPLEFLLESVRSVSLNTRVDSTHLRRAVKNMIDELKIIESQIAVSIKEISKK